jgi:hypothetical protein
MYGPPLLHEASGDIRWVFHQMTGDTDLVVPKPTRVDLVQPIAGSYFLETHQIVLLGAAFNYYADAAGEGFQLVATDSIRSNVVYRHTAGAAGQVTGQFNCYLKLSPGAATSPASDAAKLSLVRIGTPTEGNITVWFAHISATDKTGITGSPYTYS